MDSGSPDREQFDPADYWEDRLSTRYSLAGVGHMGLSRSYNEWAYRVRRRVFARLLRGLQPPAASARVLDIGSGTGFYIERWQAAGAAEIHGMDISPTAIASLRDRFPAATFHHRDISGREAAAGLERHFDSVTAMDVVFHIVDDPAFEQAIRNIHRMLREGGTFIFSDNFLHFAEQRERHIVHRRLDHVLNVLDGAGFEVVERRPMLFLMTNPVDSRSWLARVSWGLVSRAARRGEVPGWITGGLLYPLELALTALRKEGPTTEVMVCRKRGDRAPSHREAHALES